MSHWPWNVLGIARTGDKSAIRRAYAEKLKAMDIDKDIQGFANLRHARDDALREADYAEREDSGPLLADDDDWRDDDVTSLTAPADDLADVDDGEPFDEFSIGWEDIHGDFARDGGNPFGYGTGDYVDADTTVQAGRDDGPDRKLAQLLYPDGDYSDRAFTLTEAAEAQAALTQLLEDAHSGDLGQEQAVDHWLGELLAETWPRSAPLLERASTSFDWLAQSGEIGERPALQFLNPRLRGMRFTEKVEQPDHPLNKAWVELQRPGARSFVDRFKVKREDVMTLLGGIRQRYPEVESYLDADRIASWEKPAPEWVGWLVQRMFLLFIVVQALRFCADGIPERGVDEMPQVTIASPDRGILLEEYVDELLGEAASVAELREVEPALADRVSSLRQIAAREDDENAIREGAYVVRFLAYRAIETAEFDDLIRIHELRRRSASFIRSLEGDQACSKFLKEARLPDGFDFHEELRAEERKLAWSLVGKGLMDPGREPGGPETAPVPGWFTDAVIDRAGSTADQVSAVYAGEETPRDCSIRIAMLDVMLEQPGRVPTELLRLR